VALIVLASDKKLRRVIHDEGQQYFASNNTNSIPKRTISEAASEIILGSGPFLGIVVTDCSNKFGRILVGGECKRSENDDRDECLVVLVSTSING
jgi:hypothetical protein